jgi:hypothetical protein
VDAVWIYTGSAGIAITPVTITNRGATVHYYSISPTIPNGLSFNEETGVISGTPIVASDSVTYTVTAVGAHGQGPATVVITVGIGVINLALGKPATQSSIYPHRIHAVAGYAVNNNEQ